MVQNSVIFNSKSHINYLKNKQIKLSDLITKFAIVLSNKNNSGNLQNKNYSAI